MITNYERAKLRLQAFALMDGWGVHNEKGVFLPYNLEHRKEVALEFVEWAVADLEAKPHEDQ